MESILISVKKMLGIEADHTSFDTEIIMHINSALMILTQLGLGPETGFRITGTEETWASFLGDRFDIEGAKTYVYMKTRLVFDPPQMGYLVELLNKQCTEYEWRLNVEAESAKPLVEDEERSRGRRRTSNELAFLRRRMRQNGSKGEG